jgi:RNA polymerase sigma factor (sigma-70 family)
MSDGLLTALLTTLDPQAASAAWREFIAKYAPVVMHVVRRHECRQDRVHDCFVYVCGALSEDGFRRLRAFEPERRVRFTTWLMAVVSNLCVDWRRKEDGRRRPMRAVARLSELEQSVFRHIFVRGVSRAECLQILRPKFPDLTEASVAEVNARLFGLLTPEQRFLLASRRVSASSGVGDEDENVFSQPADVGVGPASLAEIREETERLQAALTQLSAEQRLILKLRFEEDLALAEIARLTGLADPFRVDRQVRGALAALQHLMEKNSDGRKKH